MQHSADAVLQAHETGHSFLFQMKITADLSIATVAT